MNTKRAPGEDNITVEIAIKAMEETEEEILDLFNKCLEKGVYPKTWKRQKIITLRKTGKNQYDIPSSYRPISLIPTIGKILDAIIINRIEAQIERSTENRDKHKHQYGFKNGKSTIDAITKLIQTIKKAKDENKYATVITIDIKAAFDRTWRQKVIQNLKTYNIPKNLIKITNNYFTDRKAKLQIGNITEEIKTEMGCPQGSKSGPGYWKIFFDKILEIKMEEDTEIIIFADDTALITTAKTWKGVKAKTEENIRKLIEWTGANRILINSDKTEGIFIPTKKSKTRPNIKLGDEIRKLKDEIRYLGMYINNKLKWDSQIKTACEKAKKIMNQMTPITYQKEGTNKTLKTIYEGAIEPGILYGAEIWGNDINKKMKRKIDQVQRKAAIKIIRAYSTLSTEAAIVLSGMVRTAEKARERAELYRIMKGVGNGEERRTLGIEQDARIEGQIIRYEHPATESKRRIPYENQGADRVDNQKIKIYTDGSKSEGGKSGAAYVIINQEGQTEETEKIRTNAESTIYQNVATAILEAIRYANQKYEGLEIEIISDSKSVLEALKNNRKKTIITERIIEEIKRGINIYKLKWTRAHQGEIGNEQADKAAKEAAEKENIDIEHGISKQIIKRKARQRTIEIQEQWYRQSKNGSYTKQLFGNTKEMEKAIRAIELNKETTQFITNHGNFKKYLKKIGKIDNEGCPCGSQEQDAQHLLFDCPIEADNRRRAETKCMRGGQWPRNMQEAQEMGARELLEIIKDFARCSETTEEEINQNNQDENVTSDQERH